MSASDHNAAVDHFERIRSTVDVDAMKRRHVVAIGGAYDIETNLARCNIGKQTIVDFDTVSETNAARQDFDRSEAGLYKVDVVAERIRWINPDTEVVPLRRDVTTLDASEVERHFGDADLIICATDDFKAHRWVNDLSIERSIPAMFISLYPGGQAGEIVYQVPGVTVETYDQIASRRFAYFEDNPVTVTPSDGGGIFDLRLADAVAGQIALGILTRGADNRFGRLIDALGDRNFIQIKIDPDFRLGGRDIFAEQLGEHPANFSWTTICLPMRPGPDSAGERKTEGTN